ncbi:Putative protein of unknown function [Podospora comata]|uniref:Zn(2)-C6 fungal-type domain-containing protein n=1 Tax=Podospora comata TaxID=48703 RepID=A0ABY6S089_PODCO|nr:Putative protein of unknown function [Podospora comata]
MAPSASPSHTPGPHTIVSPPSNQRRASTPKVRTGCITCKNRHVKCDERKPTCSRCEKARMECHGYLAKTDQKAARKSSSKSATIQGGPRPLQMIRPAPVTPFCPEKDIIYHDFFRYTLVNDLAGYLHADFWSRVVLCEGIRDGCVNHAIFAIGALSQALFVEARLDRSLARQSSGSPPSPPHSHVRWHHIYNPHYQAAIRHQNQAISLCLQRIRDDGDTMSARNLLVITLLLAGYELLQGDVEAADGLMTSGIRLLRDSITTLRDAARRNTGPTNYANREDEDTQDMEYILPFLSGTSNLRPSPPPHYTIPSSSLECNDLPVFGKTSAVKCTFLWGNFHTRCLLFISQAMQRTFAGQPLPTNERHSLWAEQAQLWNSSRQWQQVLSDYKAAVSPEDVRTRKIMLLLLLQCYTDLICLAWCLDPTGTALDNCEPDFGQLLNIALEFSEDREHMITNGFILSGGNVTGPLILIATKCRTSRTLRWQALEAFRKMSWRTGAWDAKVFVSVAGLVSLEEAARDEGGRIDPINRWLCTGIHSDVDSMKVMGEYTRASSDEKGDPIKKYLVLNVDGRRFLAEGEGTMDSSLTKVDPDLGCVGNTHGQLADQITNDGLDADMGSSINGALSPASAVTGSDFDSPLPVPTEYNSNWDGLSSREDTLV